MFTKGLIVGSAVCCLPVLTGYGPSSFVAPGVAVATDARVAPTLATPIAQGSAESSNLSTLAALGSVATCCGVAGALRRDDKRSAAQNRAAARVVRQPAVARQALDQSSRYADLSLTEEDLIKNGKHVLVAYIMKPKAGYDYLATAAHFSAESSTGTNVNVCTTDDFTKTVDALVYYIDPENEEMKIAYPTMLFDRNITDGRAMMCSVLTLTIGNNQGMGDVEYGKDRKSVV